MNRLLPVVYMPNPVEMARLEITECHRLLDSVNAPRHAYAETLSVSQRLKEYVESRAPRR